MHGPTSDAPSSVKCSSQWSEAPVLSLHAACRGWPAGCWEAGDMNQEHFVQRNETSWSELDALLVSLEKMTGTVDIPDDLPARYRRLCQQLAVARHRRYSADIVARLNGLVMRAHSQMYGNEVEGLLAQARRLIRRFPTAVRREWRVVLVAHAFFYLPYIGMMVAVVAWPELIQTVLGPMEIAEFESMYDPKAEHFLKERSIDSDTLMFGFYIYNNIGIAFRTFAGGIAGGLGSVFFLVTNGVSIGAASGHLTAVGMGSTFWSFVITHGSFELTAIVLSGAAGLKIGTAVLVPGQRTRARALTESVQAVLPIVYGFFAFLVVAAFIEAFWSSSRLIPHTTKYVVGTAAWIWVYAYLLVGGQEVRSRIDGP
ncbi:MAG: hypothetical protein CL927_18805 [Deltaproteobacteria bacterium]|nr:hypothetical protein [Deltaproteobacteria bacterium]